MHWLALTCSLSFAGYVFATPSPRLLPRQASSAATSSTSPASTACGDIIDSVNDGNLVFYASDACACLTSVPFNAAVALRFIEYYNTTMQFQSNLAYVKSPPAGYQQPAFDFFAGLDELRNNVTSGVYQNQYDFEASLQFLVYSVHDAHVDLYAGILSAFSFASPYSLLSASVDGKEAPKVYLEDHVINRQQNGPETNISAISTINGEPVVEYLRRFAALNSQGMLEPHADWNQLMGSPAQDIQYSLDVFAGGATFYPGDGLNFMLENGTEVATWWIARYSNPEFTGPLTTGGDFYNYYVLGLIPDSYNHVPLPDTFNSSLATDGSTDFAYLTNWSSISLAYPYKADVYQPQLAPAGSGGVVTGYLIDDISTGVLSIPSFDQVGWGVGNFSGTVQNFVDNATDADISRVVIDLQQNSGGAVLLAFATFKQFFPQIDPFAGSRRRSHQLANVLGNVTTSYWETLSGDDKALLDATEWVVTDRINAATEDNFTSWAEYYGPQDQYDGDDFSATEQYDLANSIFDEMNFDGWVPTYYTPGNEPNFTAPWTPDNIIILTDGVCSSACSLFLEMMVQQGVRTVVMGGEPSTGPMQAASGTRGAVIYSSDQLDVDFSNAGNYSETAAAELPQNREDYGMYFTSATFNLRDQVRKSDVATPLQFVYSAANCRLWFTLDNVYNMTALWRDVATAMWDDPSLCVEGSTGYATTGNTTTASPPPKAKAAILSAPGALSYTTSAQTDIMTELLDSVISKGKNVQNSPCDPKVPSDCVRGSCRLFTIECPGSYPLNTYVCAGKCDNIGGEQRCATKTQKCDLRSPLDSVKNVPQLSALEGESKTAVPGKTIYSGYCIPLVGTQKLGCPPAAH